MKSDNIYVKSGLVYIEKPSSNADAVELFIQTNGKHHTSCCSHIHNAVELLYVKEGSYNVTVNGTDFPLEAGDLILFCSNAIHSVYTKDLPTNSYYVIKVSPSLLLSLSDRESGAEYVMRFALHRKDRRIHWKRDEMSEYMQAALKSLTEEYARDGFAKDVAIRLRILDLLLAIMREDDSSIDETSGQTAELIYRVMTYVRDHFAEDIDERDVAADVGLSYSYFSRCFKRITGISFKQHLSITRINQAEKMLSGSNLSISEVATACGYNSISYFISVFKKVTGRTPKEAHRGANNNGEVSN